MPAGRIRNKKLIEKIVSAGEAASLICDGMVVATSGFTPSGYPKAVPLALAERANNGEKIGVTLITGASVGDELDGALTRSGVIKKRYAYQTHDDMRSSINSGAIAYHDAHLSHVSRQIQADHYGKIDVAIIEAAAIREDCGIVPSTSVGISNIAVECADFVIVEVNRNQPIQLEGIHDIYSVAPPPHGKPIPIEKAGDRIGTTYIPCCADKIAAIVLTDEPDKVRRLAPVDDDSKAISDFIIEFLRHEVKMGRLPENLLPLQSGVGSVANAVLGGLVASPFRNLSCYTEVIQDSMFDLIDAGKIAVLSGTSITPSETGLRRFIENIDVYTKYIVLRPQEISNHPEIVRRLGVISINTAIEADIYAHVNSSNVMGSRIMNGIGGSGDFTRNAYISIFTTVSTEKNGRISSIVPMCSHVDHSEHDVHVLVTEQGLADLRGASPTERAKLIIEKCAHPDYKPMLTDYFERALAESKYKHEPHILTEALSWHDRFLREGSMLP